MTIGEKLFQLRKQKNLSQEEVANRLNVSRQTISKWETDQSLPDFDKIVPLCELYEISTEELLKGEKPETVVESESEIKKGEQALRVKTAKVVSVSVLIFFVAVIWIILASDTGFNENLTVCIFLAICAAGAIPLVFHFMTLPQNQEEIRRKKEEEENKTLKLVDSVLGMLFTCLYFIVSFATMAWGITWIIFLIYGLVMQIIKLCYQLWEESKNEK